MSAGKGSARRPEISAGAYAQGWDRIYGKSDFIAHVVFFDDAADHRWRIMAEVLEYSLRRFGHDCVLHELPAPSAGTVCKARNNSFKLEKWNSIVQAASHPVLLLDADMVCLKPLDGAFSSVDHVGVTWRDPQYLSPSPLNGGLIFVRTTDWAREFFNLWLKVDARVLRDQGFARKYRVKWSGQNQAALGAMIETGKAEKLTRLECQELNLCEPWARLEDARILHTKSRMISMLWGGLPMSTDDERAAVSAWRKVYEEKLTTDCADEHG